MNDIVVVLTQADVKFLIRVLESWSPAYSRKVTKEDERQAQRILDKLEEINPTESLL